MSQAGQARRGAGDQTSPGESDASAASVARSDGAGAGDGAAREPGAQRLTPLRELQLLEAHRLGGPDAHEALCELVTVYQRRVYGICFRMVRQREEAADLTQDVLLRIIENLGSYNGQSKLSTWVFRVTMNFCLSYLRKRKLRGHERLDEHGIHRPGGGQPDRMPITASTLSGAGRRELSPGSHVEHQQARSGVLAALESIDPDMRAILVLRDVQDLDYQQLAEVLEIPLGTVKSRLFRARAALRDAVEALDGGARRA